MGTTDVRQMRTVVSVKSLIWKTSSGCMELRVGMRALGLQDEGGIKDSWETKELCAALHQGDPHIP